jgi:RNA polymerase sigma-70 factor (ECF subfamily)
MSLQRPLRAAARRAEQAALAATGATFESPSGELANQQAPRVTAIAGRDDQAIMVVWRRFGPLVERTLQRMLGSDEEVRDLSQEAFLQLYRSVPALRSAKAIRPFVDGIAVHLALHERRRRRTRARHVLLPGQGPIPQRTTNADPEARQAMERLLRLVRGLRGLDQELFILRQIEGLEQTDIAAITGLSISTVRRHLRRIRRRIDLQVSADPALAAYAARAARDADW